MRKLFASLSVLAFAASAAAAGLPETALESGIGRKSGVALEGRVTDQRGAPVAGASVSLSCVPPRPGGFQPADTDAAGRFRIEDLPRGALCDLSVWKAGFEPFQLSAVEAPARELLQVELTAAQVLTGRVVDPSGRPVPKARIRAVEMREAASSLVAGMETGATGGDDGRFELVDLTAGTFDLTFFAAGFKKKTLRRIEVPYSSEAPLEVTLEKGESLEGRIVDSRGKRVAGARVTAGDDLEQASDSDGRYRVDGLEPGLLTVSAIGPNQETASASLDVQPGANHLDLAFPGGVEVDGRVLDPSGVPVPGAAVTFQPVSFQGLGGKTFRTTTSSDGSFRFQTVAEGDYALSGEKEGLVAMTEPGAIHVARQALHGLELRLQRGALLTGRLLGFTPEELRLVRILASREQSSGDPLKHGVVEKGSYRVASLLPGRWQVLATTGARFARGTVVIDSGVPQATLDIEMAAGFTLSGRVVLDEAPLADAMVSLQGSPEGSRWSKTTRDGHFQITGLAAGSYLLTIAGPDGIRQTREIEISADQTISLEIWTGSASGQVLSVAGEPIAGADISLVEEIAPHKLGPLRPAEPSSEQGSFDLPRLAAGNYRITVWKEGFGPTEKRFIVTPGGTVQLQVVLKELPGSSGS